MFNRRIKTIIKYYTMKKTYSICSFLLLLLVFSCSKKAPFYDELGQGSYLNLVKTNNTNLNSTDANSSVGMVVKEYGEPVESVNLYVSTTATLDKTKWKLIKNFPYASGSELTLAATTTQIATALGITQASMAPGTTYFMYNEVVTKDGRKFSSANTSFVDLESQPGFNVALSWRATVVCPFNNTVPFDNKVWHIVRDDWQDFAVGDPVTVQLGPGANQITLVGVWPTDVQHKDMVITIDPTSGAATVPRYTYGGYGSAATYTNATTGTSNFVFACTQTIDVTMNHVSSGGTNYGNYRLILKP